MTKQACYWIIGSENKSQPPAVAVDLHDSEGELIAETWTAELLPSLTDAASLKARAESVARRYAETCGVTELTYDPDSTEYFRND